MLAHIGLPSERPVRRHAVESFYMSEHPVTVGQFREFINATNYITEAERFGNSGVFSFQNSAGICKIMHTGNILLAK